MAAHIRVLVAEDDPAARRLLSEALPRLPGLSLCGVAADGLECLALIDQLQPDVVLLDLVMPGLDGLGVLRALAGRRGRPVLVVTSQVSYQGVVRCALALGASYYLVKPLNCQALPQLLRFLCLAPLQRAALSMLAAMGASGLGMEAAARAAVVLHQHPNALLKEAYAPTIAGQRTCYGSVEKNIRSMVDKLHAAARPAYIDLMGGLPPQRPSNLVFLRQLARSLAPLDG